MADYFPFEKNTVPAAGNTLLFGFNRNGLVIDHLLQKAEVIGPNARTVFGMLAPQPDGTWGYRDAHLSVLTTKNHISIFPNQIITSVFLILKMKSAKKLKKTNLKFFLNLERMKF